MVNGYGGTGVVARGWLTALTGEGGWIAGAAATGEPARRWGLLDLADKARALELTTVYVAGLGGWDGIVPPAPLCEVTGGRDEAGAWRYRIAGGIGCGERNRAMPVELPAVNVVILERDVSRMAGPWSIGLDPRELTLALGAAGRVLGVPWADSIGRTAERLILSTHPRGNGGRLLDRSPKTPAPCESGGLEIAWLGWRRDLTAAERRGRWVHVFDVNAHYLAAWGNAELGFGVPVHHPSPRPFDPRVVGFWRIPGGLDGLAVPHGELLPTPWIPGREWYATATLARVWEVCNGLDLPVPAECWLWPHKSRYLRAAAERLRDARRDAMAELDRRRRVLREAPDATRVDVERFVTAGVVLEAVKDVYRVQTGRFNQAGRAEGSPWRRPDWGHTVRAVARANLHRTLTGLGAAPVAIATDAAVFVDDEPDPGVFAARVGLRVGTGLGQWKHAGTAAVAGDVAAALEGERPVRLMRAIRSAELEPAAVAGG